MCVCGSFLRFIYYLFLAVSGLSCGTQEFHWGMRDLSLRRAGFSLVVACSFLFSSCGARAPGRVGSGSCGTRVPERMGSVACGTWALSLRHGSSVVVACRLSCPVARGILVPWPKDRTKVPYIGRQILYHWTTSEVPQISYVELTSLGFLYHLTEGGSPSDDQYWTSCQLQQLVFQSGTYIQNNFLSGMTKGKNWTYIWNFLCSNIFQPHSKQSKLLLTLGIW